MSDDRTQRTIDAVPIDTVPIDAVPIHTVEIPEPEWKIAFRKAKSEAENELQEIHREAARRAREHLQRAS